MSFIISHHINYTLITASTAKIDAIISPNLKSELVILNKKGIKNIILDLELVKYCDSSGLSALLIGDRICKDLNGSFMICNLQPSVQKLISISQLTTILNIKTSVKEAVDSNFVEEIEKKIGSGQAT